MATTINSNTTDGVIITPDTSGEIELQADGVTKAKITANGLQDNNGNSLRGGSFRNLVINGDMQIAQRGTSTTGITGTGYYTVDRFSVAISGLGTWTQTQSTDVPTGQGFTNSLKMACTTADASPAVGDYLSIKCGFEGQNLQHLKYGTSSAETMTLTFWVKSNKTGTYNVMGIQDDNSIKLLSLPYTITSADTWEKKTLTIPADVNGNIDNDNGQGLRLNFYLAAGTNRTSGSNNTAWGTYVTANEAPSQVNLADSTSNYINITGVQLEVGEGASNFEHLPYDVQLQRCQRYYYKTGGTIRYYKNSSNTNAEAYPLGFPVYMRVSPSMSFGTVSTGGNTSTYSIAGSSNQSTTVQITANGSAGYARLDAQLIADSEL